MEFSSVSSDRQKWEDAVNASFAFVRAAERVCWHANCTVWVRDGLVTTRCDYCPAWTETVHLPEVPAPWYFRDEDPLFI